MNISFLRAPDTHDARAKRLAATFYAYTFFDQFILLYPFYALLFVDTGLSTAEISSLLVIWSVTAIVTEVPSGVWADVVSRRRLLALAPLLAAAGFALWVVAPSYWVFAAGFVLWGTSGALQSGATEALVYTELDRLGAADRYAAITGRGHAIATAAVMASMAVAAPLFALGGYPLVGAASVLSCVIATAVATTFPEHRERAGKGEESEESEEETSPGGYTAILRDGLREVRADRSIRRVLLLVAVVTALWGALEEYVPLLAVDTGVTEHVVPLLLLLVSAGTAIGGVLAATGRRFTDRKLAGILGFGALALAAGAISGLAVGFFVIAAAFCAFQMASVLTAVRLQQSITGPARATVTSLAGLGVDVVAILFYGGYAAASTVTGNATIFAVSAVPYAVVALVLFFGGFRSRRAAARTDLGDPRMEVNHTDLGGP
ncbi:MFS transporter [Streptosporangium subroseum]|uniref:MFS transporter n=1 Tax=Streptosporangium subroseum TaxID=106412 RepID=UPI00308547A7|nr:MFS transporter [Streptosporangium subroseum]